MKKQLVKKLVRSVALMSSLFIVLLFSNACKSKKSVIQIPLVNANVFEEFGTSVNPDKATTFILVRHAEKQKTEDRNPQLTEDGRLRANELSKVLSHFSFDKIYSSNYYRTISTAEPTSEKSGLDIEIYNPSELEAFKNRLLAEGGGQTILIVGHSNTTPNLVNLITGKEDIGKIPEYQYDDLFVVMKDSKNYKTTRYKYGKSTIE